MKTLFKCAAYTLVVLVLVPFFCSGCAEPRSCLTTSQGICFSNYQAANYAVEQVVNTIESQFLNFKNISIDISAIAERDELLVKQVDSIEKSSADPDLVTVGMYYQSDYIEISRELSDTNELNNCKKFYAVLGHELIHFVSDKKDIRLDHKESNLFLQWAIEEKVHLNSTIEFYSHIAAMEACDFLYIAESTHDFT
jgi:antirestriction protein ArdC